LSYWQMVCSLRVLFSETTRKHFCQLWRFWLHSLAQ